MRNIFIIIFFVIHTTASAKDYYVSSTSGIDSNNGISISTPWKTISKVNSVFSSFNPGDRVLFNRGDVFYGTITITKSGSAGSPIIFGAYGTGVNPIITGFTTITGWTNEGGGIYSKIITTTSQANIVTINGVQFGKGRFPDTAFNPYESFVTNVSITDIGLGDATDWAGAEVIIRKNDWSLDKCVITDHTGDKITYTNLGTTQSATAKFGYFIQNDLRCINSYGEWYHNSGTGKFYMYFGSVDPLTKMVKVSSIDYLITTNGMDYITIDNISFEGGNKNSLNFLGSGSDNVVIQNCSIDFSGGDGIHAEGGNNWIIDNNLINHSSGAGVFVLNGSNKSITNNTVKNSGLIPGIANSGTTANGLSINYQTNALIRYNNIDSSGYNGILFMRSNASKVINNFINHSCLLLDDGGGIYTHNDAYTGRIIDGNIILNSIGNNSGTPHSYVLAEGIYLDEYSGNIEVTNNSIANCSASGIKLHKAHDNKISNNTTFNNAHGIYFLNSSGSNIRNILMNGNIFSAETATQNTLNFSSVADDIASFGISDNNYYVRPIDDNNVIKTYQPSTGSKTRNLTGWQSFTIQDANSQKSPISISDTSNINFYYNASKTNKEITLAQPMIDVKGAKYQSSITLLPYTSVVLMVDPNPATPVLPVFTGAVVENSIPTILEMSYHIDLANIVPAASAFTVQVNGVNRAVSSVAVSNKKVQLTLASAVIFGDVVTVSYTTPATNPLQTVAGYKAESISAKTVTNNCLSTIPVYVSSVIENATPAVLEITYNLNLANIIPVAAAFSVLVNSVSRTISSVAISGSKVKLTLASPVVYGNTLTVSYTAPSINPIQSVSGGKAENLSSKTVTNNCSPPAPVYSSSVIENASPALLIITFSSSLDNTATSPSAFNVQVNSASRTVNSVAIAGGKVQLTLASAIVSGDIVTVTYTAPASNPLKTPSGGLAVSFSSMAVTNNCISAFPVYLKSAVENGTPSMLEITYDQSLANIVPSASAFNVQVNSASRTVLSVAIAGTIVRLTLASAIIGGDVITVSYTAPATNPLQNGTGGLAVNLSAKSVTNNLNTAFPVYTSSVIENSTPSLIEITFNSNLANLVPATSAFAVRVNSVTRSISSVAISGTKVQLTLSLAVIYGDIITISYTVPASNPLQNTSGGIAESFTDNPVTNNCSPPGPLYISSLIENETPNVLEMLYDLNLANIIPDVSVFTVQVNSESRSVSSLAIVGNRVRLILASAINGGDVVTFSYTAPSTNPLQNTAGGLAANLNAKSVTNNVSTAAPVYISSVIENTTPSLLEITYISNLANTVPPLSAFTVTVNSLSRNINSIEINGKKVLITLANAVVYGDIVTISYTASAINPLQTASGGKAASLSNQQVINNCVAVIPYYISSVINKSTPEILEITYNLTLAGNSPATYAFNVMVNNVNITINSVAIFGDKVRLTLSSPVVFGDLVTISYSKPSDNPIQTNAGGLAENLIAQSVTNNCQDNSIPNNSPVVLVVNETDSYSGFVYELDASGSYDPDNDNLTYEWIIPDNIAASSNNSSRIRFLTPVLKTSMTSDFQLNVNDGKSTQSAIIPINILPYKPELYTVRIANIEASEYQADDNPKNVIDGNLSTKWSADGENQWLMLKLALPFKISHLQLAFLQGQQYESFFDIYASHDNLLWNPILTSISSCDFSGDLQVFDFPVSESNTAYEYIKIVGHGNSKNLLNIVSEFKIFGIIQKDPDSGDSKETSFIIYPNPAQDFVNISIEEPILVPDEVNIIDNTGRIVFEDSIEPGIINIQIPNNFNTGIYYVVLKSDNNILDAVKLIINK